MNCRGEKRRIDIVRKYNVKQIAHIKLLEGESKRSEAEAELTDQYYIFECALKTDSSIVETIICGSGAANHFLSLTGEEGLPLFNPLKGELSQGSKGVRGDAVDTRKWNEQSKQLYEAIQWLIICWDIIPRPGSAIISIKRKLEERCYKEPFISDIKSINTVISRGSRGKTLTEMIDKFRAKNDIKNYDFTLLKQRLESKEIPSSF